MQGFKLIDTHLQITVLIMTRQADVRMRVELVGVHTDGGAVIKEGRWLFLPVPSVSF